MSALIRLYSTILVAAHLSLASAKCAKIEKISVQLKWLVQAQFAGYTAGREIGGIFNSIYKKECVYAQIRSGDPFLQPIREVIEGFSDVGVVSGTSFYKEVAENGANVTSIGSFHQKNGMVLVARKNFCGRVDPPCSVKDLQGKTIGVSRDGEVPVADLLAKSGVTATLEPKGFGVNDLLSGKHAAQSLMMFNEVGVIYEKLNPDTNFLYTPEDIIIWDNLSPQVDELMVVRDEVLAKKPEVIKNFLRGLIKAWTYCRQNEAECVGLLPNNDKLHQRFMLREIHRMHYPSPKGFGYFDKNEYWAASNLLLKNKKISKLPAALKIDNSLMQAALKEVEASGEYSDLNGLKYNAKSLEFCAPKSTNDYAICKGFETTLCPAGQEAVAHGQCAPCAKDSYAPEEDKGTVCQACPDGFYTEGTGGTECLEDRTLMYALIGVAAGLVLIACIVGSLIVRHFQKKAARFEKLANAKLPDNVQEVIEKIYGEIKDHRDGSPCHYIPELRDCSDEHADRFGIVVCDLKGKVYKVGDTGCTYTLQSTCKVLLYCQALMNNKAAVSKVIGTEPTGKPFNDLSINRNENKVSNPYVNAGGITSAAYISGTARERYQQFEQLCKEMSFDDSRPKQLTALDEAAYASEMASNDVNANIASELSKAGFIPSLDDAKSALDAYTLACSISTTAEDSALMAATYANKGVNPITKNRVIDEKVNDEAISIMISCGMYNGAGQWIVDVGVPAKSGVGGGVIGVVPGVCGFATFSPRLDQNGNSVRGVEVAKAMSEALGLHVLKGGKGNSEQV
eukprot:TRINITY_DN15966_c0_g1_i1.p1 TRINITY_DN15966_c0_g1~~TRINITY_DN15966_c0_g1_i1.p1  ORF type:complete len:812 (+),score=176.22 TRINITY_DN15966_c0_g1_i1:55-2436(+)